MARMIPGIVSPDCTSQGEALIYNRFLNDPKTDDWIVLHSLDIANHTRNVSGEIDFVVIIPCFGVLCLEVKGCHRLLRQDGAWYYGQDYSPDYRGPFKQAKQGMYSIIQPLKEQHPELRDILFWHAVVFPYIEFTDVSDEWQEWEVIDQNLLNSRQLSDICTDIIGNARCVLAEKVSSDWIERNNGKPDKNKCIEISQLLRPDFEFYESPKSRAEQLQADLKKFTSEQVIALDAMENNDRVIFTGLAGTGKTLLAIEAARRGINKGMKILLLCFNRRLGKWLQDQTMNLGENLDCRTLHSHMMNVSGLDYSDSNSSTDFWDVKLPDSAMMRLLESDSEFLPYDLLIVDEAQDIIKTKYIEYLDLLLNNGIKGGNWRFFGDFEKQVIYTGGCISLDSFINEWSGGAPQFNLRVNCRNTPRVANLAYLLSELRPGYSRILRNDDGSEPVIKYYDKESEQAAMLISTLNELQVEGFSPQDIIILSANSDNKSLAKSVATTNHNSLIAQFDEAGENQIRFCSIHSFKGLESLVIIITDLHNLTDLQVQSLTYIAITRTLSRMILILHESTRDEIFQILQADTSSMGAANDKPY